MKTVVLFFVCVVVFFSCKKPIKPFTQQPSKCPEMYDVRSELLDLLKHDTLYPASQSCMGSSDNVSDTLYYFYGVNPTNPYEIMYIKRAYNTNLYKYNFCTNKQTLIKENTPYYTANSISWSSKDWVIYNYGNKLYKIKSNGDNLTLLMELPDAFVNYNWNPNGTKFTTQDENFQNGGIYDENGVLINTIDSGKVLGWLDDDNLLLSLSGNVWKLNIHTLNQEHYFSGSFVSYDYQSDMFLSYQDSSNYRKWLVTYGNGTTLEHPYHLKAGFSSMLKQGINNKLIGRLTTRERSPDAYCNILYKDRIAIMNMDGSNVRTVNIPE